MLYVCVYLMMMMIGLTFLFTFFRFGLEPMKYSTKFFIRPSECVPARSSLKNKKHGNDFDILVVDYNKHFSKNKNWIRLVSSHVSLEPIRTTRIRNISP
jgi:hypothetical protein